MLSIGIPKTLTSDLSLSIDNYPRLADIYQDIEFTYRIDNLGPDNAYSISLTIKLPDDTKFISANDFCEYDTGEVNCAISQLDVSQSAYINVVIRRSSEGTFAISGHIDGTIQNDPDNSNNNNEFSSDGYSQTTRTGMFSLLAILIILLFSVARHISLTKEIYGCSNNRSGDCRKIVTDQEEK
jgi:hypothetical protein